jgi:RNA polymerase sigma factor (sigma-70 family)
MSDLLSELAPMVQGIASEFGRRHRIHGAEADDFAQELYAWILSNQTQVELWLDCEAFDEREGTRLLAGALRNECKDYAVDIKAQALGYERRDLHWYGKGEVRALLPSVFNEDAWHEPPQSEGRSTKAPSEGGNWIATLADVAQAITKLEPRDQSLLRMFHEDGWTNKMVAESLQVSEQVMSYQHDRAVGRLVKLLGDTAPRPMRDSRDYQRDPFRGRKAVSNAAARAYQSAVYDD